MSCNVDTSPSVELQWFRFGYDTLNKHQDAGASDQVILEEKDDIKDDESSVMVNTSISLDKSEQGGCSIESKHANSFGDFEDEDSESFLGKVSTLLDHYNEVYEKH